MSNYIHPETDGQLAFSINASQFLMIPSGLNGFHNTDTDVAKAVSGRKVVVFNGELVRQEDETVCPNCRRKMHVNNSFKTELRHLPFGSSLTRLKFPRIQYRCLDCGQTKVVGIPFKAEHHRITAALEQYTKDLLAAGKYTLKQVAEITGLGKNTVKDIDAARLKELYTIDGDKLIQPEKPARFLGIDEFKLHDGYRYATHIIDMSNGHILWIAKGKRKQVVYDFIRHVGLEWMDHVEAVACDMNSDFQEAFEEMCPHIQPVFDYFHIVKNFNDKVVSEVRKEEQRRLIEEGREEEAKHLKRSRYILTSSRDTLRKKDEDARNGRIYHKGSPLFGTDDLKRKEGYESRYDELLSENKLLFLLDLIKEKLTAAYRCDDECRMSESIIEIMDLCEESQNKHLLWFRHMLDSHFEGIIAHATYRHMSSGKIEGINNKIKTLRRQGYGYPDDEYFFLKLFDASRTTYVRNPASHRICD